LTATATYLAGASMAISWTSKMSVDFGGMVGDLPASP
jgi:hypothetical protein